MNKKRRLHIMLGMTCFISLILISSMLYENQIKTRDEEERITKIGITTYQEGDEYIDSIMRETELAAEKYKKENKVKVNINIVAAKGDQNEQNRQVEKFIALGYDVICVNAVDRTNINSIIDQSIEAGIPIIFFNREPVQDDLLRSDHIYYIGSDAKLSAILQGKMISNLYKENPETIDKNRDGKIQYAMLEGEVGHQDAIIRSEWSIEAIKSAGIEVECVTAGVANWMRDQGAALVEQWLSKYPEQIEVIVCNNDEMALGAITTLKKFKMRDIKVVGIDGIKKGIQAVDGGEMLGTVCADVEQYGRYIFETAYSLAKNGAVITDLPLDRSRNIWIPWSAYIGHHISS